jgi:hypothetical protein
MIALRVLFATWGKADAQLAKQNLALRRTPPNVVWRAHAMARPDFNQ